MTREKAEITIFKDGKVAFTRILSGLIDVALEVDPGDERILKRRAVRDKARGGNGSRESERD